MRSLSKTRRFRQAVIAWCSGVESNHRHRDFQSLALPTELPLRRHSSSARRLARTTQGPARAERVLWNWCIEMGLNHRCAGLQPAALPLSYRCMKQAMEVEVCQVAQASRPGQTCFLAKLERMIGLEPMTCALATRCSTTELHPRRITYFIQKPNKKYGAGDETRTREPPPWQGGALPTELLPQKKRFRAIRCPSYSPPEVIGPDGASYLPNSLDRRTKGGRSFVPVLALKVVELKGIEPSFEPCHGPVLPLNDSPSKTVLIWSKASLGVR